MGAGLTRHSRPWAGTPTGTDAMQVQVQVLDSHPPE